jgi:hypothetical protein
MAGLLNDEDHKFIETWESVSESLHFIIRFGPMNEPNHEPVAGQRKFQITTAERVVTQSKVVDPANDPFLNGSFRPLIVPSSISVETNPNALSDDDIRRIFVSSDVAWDEYMKVLDAAATLRRMLDLAEDSDLAIRRYRELEQKLAELNPRVRVTQKDSDLFASTGPAPTPTPMSPETRGPGRPRKTQASASSSHVTG